MLKVKTTSPEDTQKLASTIAELAELGDFIVLNGDLGAGKTCFAQGFGRSLGISDKITSPTFALANQYQGRILFHHLDVYRLNSAEEAFDLDLDDLIASGVVLVEWGSNISDVIPNDHLEIKFSCDPKDEIARNIELVFNGQIWLDKESKYLESLQGWVTK